MNKSYCALPFRETMMVPGDVLLLCCAHNTNVIIKNSFDETFKSGKIQEIRELMLSGKPVSGCEQCYIAESQGIESLRERSIKKYGVVTDIKLQAVEIQFDNVCNLKCRMCTSAQSHLIYNDEVEIFGKAISWKKFIETDRYKEIDISELKEVRIHGGEPFLSPRAEEFFYKIIQENQIKQLSISTPTNGMIKPTGAFLTAIQQCKVLSIIISIDAYGDLNDYFRSKSNFNTVIDNLDFFYSLIDQRPVGSTTVGVSTTVNVYNVNKLQELDLFLQSRYPYLKVGKSFLHNPDYLRISCLPKDYKNKIRHTVVEYPNVLKMLDKEDTDYFEEFIFYHRQLDSIRQESLGNLNLELSEFIENYKFKKEIATEHIIKFSNFIDPGVFDD
jgi:MoaA/NifB/PqqE/SkfB family radical SAM enzyme